MKLLMVDSKGLFHTFLLYVFVKCLILSMDNLMTISFNKSDMPIDARVEIISIKFNVIDDSGLLKVALTYNDSSKLVHLGPE